MKDDREYRCPSRWWCRNSSCNIREKKLRVYKRLKNENLQSTQTDLVTWERERDRRTGECISWGFWEQDVWFSPLILFTELQVCEERLSFFEIFTSFSDLKILPFCSEHLASHFGGFYFLRVFFFFNTQIWSSLPARFHFRFGLLGRLGWLCDGVWWYF